MSQPVKTTEDGSPGHATASPDGNQAYPVQSHREPGKGGIFPFGSLPKLQRAFGRSDRLSVGHSQPLSSSAACKWLRMSVECAFLWVCDTGSTTEQ